MAQSNQKVRYAVVGQGWFAQTAVLPAFVNTSRNSVLAAIVSGDPVKREELGKQYGVPAYPYEQYDALLARREVDAVYIVLPNSMHCDYTMRAARAGVHVLCEKPMASSSEECRQMIAACEKAGTRLMVAYRLHFEEGNLEAAEILKSGKLGPPRLFHSFNCQQVEEGNIRLDAGLAGGPLMDIGIYCINAARYLFREDPVEVACFSASSPDTRFREVPEMTSAVMRFPDARLATFSCGFGEAKKSMYEVVGTRGSLRMDPAFSFNTDLHLEVTLEGDSSRVKFGKRDHVGAEILYFSDCVLNGTEPEPSGLEGLIDLRIIEALRESSRTGRAVKLETFPRKPRPSKRQEIRVSPFREPELVHAQPPSGE